ncbi:hypothetical protein ASU85_23810 [Klebsiella aerogenes]|uniref:DUF4214 domain-containing protein n=1 Tax=Klebsiella aerogenes TaxID=548 RepID=UPI00073520E9|nr:DUF4214 domain-containing protein [Klebsiella aerogenes]KTJ37206.1 hypothetical protein ASU85_23810 [Klebsiella aerogenes]
MTNQVLLTQQQVAAIQYAVLGNDKYTTGSSFDQIAGQFRAGVITQEDYIGHLLESEKGKSLYSGQSDVQILKSIYEKLNGGTPDDRTIEKILGGNSLNSAIHNCISDVLYYNGFENEHLQAQHNLDEHLNAMMFKDYGTNSWDTWSSSVSLKEDVSSAYIALAGRSADMSGLSYWTNYLTKNGHSFDSVLKNMLSSPELKQKVGHLEGEDFIKHVYHAVYGQAPTSEQISKYEDLGNNKVIVTKAIINDIRNNASNDNEGVIHQHNLDNEIGNSLLYKTSAALTSSEHGGNATGTINTEHTHVLSNAETAVLTNIKLNIGNNSGVDLSSADHLNNLEINGGPGGVITLSTDSVDSGVKIIANNSNVKLEASSGSDAVTLNSLSDISHSNGVFNLGAGNDTLAWNGNAARGYANTVSNSFIADGGEGIDSISANLITKNVLIKDSLLHHSAVIETNSSQFTGFEQLDLTGYIGQATVNKGSVAIDHTFDFGLLTGHATTESSVHLLPGEVTQAATSTIGSLGFTLSGFADNVNVLNISGVNSGQLEVVGDATVNSSLAFNFLENATDHFNINFNAHSDHDINAGSVSLKSSSSVLGTSLDNVNIYSGGDGDFTNVLNLNGDNSQVKYISVSGNHYMKLSLDNGFSNVRDIDASMNTAGINLNTDHGGTGDGIIMQILDKLPLSAATTHVMKPVLDSLNLNGYQFKVNGSSDSDDFTVSGNTTVTGGAGNNNYHLTLSNISSGVTITDFNASKDTIFDGASGLKISNDVSSTSVADYGIRTSDVLDGILGKGIAHNGVDILGEILGLGNDHSLTAKVGVASVAFGGKADSYLIIDNNNNHTLDSNDSVVYLTGQNHTQLVETLHFS